PRPNTSSRWSPQDTAAGALVKSPPSGSQPPQPPSNQLWYIWSSVPIAKISSRPAPHETAAGGLLNIPPRLTQPCQELPSQDLCQIRLSAPSAKISSRFGPQETTAGWVLNPPSPAGTPSPSQSVMLGYQPVGVHALWYI